MRATPARQIARRGAGVESDSVTDQIQLSNLPLYRSAARSAADAQHAEGGRGRALAFLTRIAVVAGAAVAAASGAKALTAGGAEHVELGADGVAVAAIAALQRVEVGEVATVQVVAGGGGAGHADARQLAAPHAEAAPAPALAVPTLAALGAAGAVALTAVQRRLDRVPRAMIGLARLLPGHGTPSAARVGRRLLRALSGGGTIESHARPFRVTFSNCPVATLDELGTGCSLYTGALETLVRGYSGREARIVHEDCRARGGQACVWTEVVRT